MTVENIISKINKTHPIKSTNLDSHKSNSHFINHPNPYPNKKKNL